MAHDDLAGKLESYRQACRKATAWLLALSNGDGSIGPVQQHLCYYRVPWALALMGESTAAHRVVDWIARYMFTPEGAFEGVSPRGGYDTRYGTYPLACLITGAALLQRFDIVYPRVRNLLSWQDPVSGGFYNTPGDRTDSAEQELFPTAQAGMTLVLTGQIDAARLAGAWFRRLWDLQPDPDHMLYAVYTRAHGLVRDFPGDQQVTYVTLKDQPWQYHYNGGIAAAFLAHLYMATGEAEWLDLARSYEEFSMTTDECQFRSMQTCKSGWGSGLLYVATREEKYRAWTARMGDWFVANQCDDGHWENTKHWVPAPTVANNLEITAEFIMHLAHITAYLSV
jgi:hypothetical protein